MSQFENCWVKLNQSIETNFDILKEQMQCQREITEHVCLTPVSSSPGLVDLLQENTLMWAPMCVVV